MGGVVVITFVGRQTGQGKVKTLISKPGDMRRAKPSHKKFGTVTEVSSQTTGV